MTGRDFRQAPEPWLAPVALDSPNARSALALQSFGVTGVRVGTQPVAAAQGRTASEVGTLCRGFSVGAAAEPAVLAGFVLQNALICR